MKFYQDGVWVSKVSLQKRVIRSLDDLIAVGTLVGDTLDMPACDLIIDNTIITPYKIHIPNDGSFMIESTGSNYLYYTGTGSFLNGSICADKYLALHPRALILVPNGAFLDINGTQGGTFLSLTSFISVKKGGTFRNCKGSLYFSQIKASTGSLILDNCSSFSSNACYYIFTSTDGVDFFDVRTTTSPMDYANFSNNFFTSVSSHQYVLSIDTNTVINTNFKVVNSLFNGISTAATSTEIFNPNGLGKTDIRIISKDNYPTDDSTAYGQIYSTANILVTTGSSSPVLSSVTWITDGMERFVLSPEGFLTYIGLDHIYVSVAGSLELNPASGAATSWKVEIAKNNVIMPYSADTKRFAGGDTLSSQPYVVTDLKTGDNIEIYITRMSGTGNVTVQSGRLSVRK